MIELLGTVSTVISLLRDANTAHDSYKKVTGIIHGTDNEKLMQSIEKMHYKNVQHNTKMIDSFERLSEHIIYAPNLKAIKDTNVSRQRKVDGFRQVREFLDPIQKALGGDLLSSAIILTPEKMEKAFNKNPWKVLIDVRPISRASKPNDIDMIPFLFNDNGIQYIGWQKKGVLPIMFDCEYDEIWTPSSRKLKKTSKQNIQESSLNEEKSLLDSKISTITSSEKNKKLDHGEFLKESMEKAQEELIRMSKNKKNYNKIIDMSREYINKLLKIEKKTKKENVSVYSNIKEISNNIKIYIKVDNYIRNKNLRVNIEKLQGARGSLELIKYANDNIIKVCENKSNEFKLMIENIQILM